MHDLKRLATILSSARRVMTYNEVSHITVARAEALHALLRNLVQPETMVVAIMEACSAGIVGEETGVTVRRAQTYYEFLNQP